MATGLVHDWLEWGKLVRKQFGYQQQSSNSRPCAGVSNVSRVNLSSFDLSAFKRARELTVW